MLSATFFVASLINVPVGPSSVHLILNGLAGLLLGWAAFPALFVGLLLQTVFFGFGGLTVLGVNTFNIALPAVLVFYLCKPGLRSANPITVALWGGLGGTLATLGTALLVAVSLALTGDAFIPVAKLVIVAHIPVMLIEGLLTAFALILTAKVKPELFAAPSPAQ